MRLKKSLGQYILTDETVVQKIIGAVSPKQSDTILEVGPGTGRLTRQLAGKVKLLLAVEKDFRMAARLRRDLEYQVSSIKIIHQDILSFDETAIEGPYKLVGNLPYNIASPIIRKFLESKHPPTFMVVMIQKEVAERITAPPGSSERGILTVMVEYYGKAQKLFDVTSDAFIPIPKIDSSLVKIVPNYQLSIINSNINYQLFFRVVKAGFSAKRRQLCNSLAGGLHLPKTAVYDILKQARINGKKRAEDLSIKDWQRIHRAGQAHIGDV